MKHPYTPPRPSRLAFLIVLGSLSTCSLPSTALAQSPPDSLLIEYARSFPAQPRESIDLLQGGLASPGDFTFGSGTPFNDVAYTLYDVDYIDGETNGFDTFEPADAADVHPGDGTVKLVRGTSNLDLDEAYSGPAGDRIILGRPETPPYFLRGADGVDDEWAVIQNYDYAHGYIQLKGTASDYALVWADAAVDSVATTGHYLFHVVGGEPDLVAFIWPCDVSGLPVSGNPFRNQEALCDDDRRIALDDGINFRFVSEANTGSDLVEGALAQFGTPGKEIVHGIVVDGERNLYLFGASDGTVGGTLPEADNTAWVRRINADGTTGWTYELAVTNGTLLFDGDADGEHLYLGGRTLGALPGATNAGRWDGILLKLDLATGALVASDQFGTASLDGYGNLILDGAGALYVSGAGGEAAQEGTDPDHLVAKHRTSDLANVWRRVDAPEAGDRPVFVSEAWGGLSYAAATDTTPSRLLAGGWYMTSGGSAGFVSLYEEVDTDSPVRAHTASLDAAGTEADWVLDNVIGPDGSLYVAGYTTGSLGGEQAGEGDAFVARYDADLTNPTVVQVGSDRADMFRKLEFDEDASRLYGVGYTYGDLGGTNPDDVLGTGDVYIQSFDLDLQPLAAIQFGTRLEDRAFADVYGDYLFVGGYTEGGLADANAGAFDAYALALDGSDLSVVPQSELTIATTRVEIVPAPESSLQIWPNPTRGTLNLELGESFGAAGFTQSEAARATVRDPLGRVVLSQNLTSSFNQVDLGRLSAGSYLLTVRSAAAANTMRVIVE